MRVRKPIHLARYGLWPQLLCGERRYWDSYGKEKCGGTVPARRGTVKVEYVTCEECLTEIIRIANIARAARLRAIGESKRAVERRTRRNVPGRHARNGLEDLVGAV